MKVFVFIILWTSKLLSASVMVPHCPTQTCTPCPAFGLLGYGYPSCVLRFFCFFFLHRCINLYAHNGITNCNSNTNYTNSDPNGFWDWLLFFPLSPRSALQTWQLVSSSNLPLCPKVSNRISVNCLVFCGCALIKKDRTFSPPINHK